MGKSPEWDTPSAIDVSPFADYCIQALCSTLITPVRHPRVNQSCVTRKAYSIATVACPGQIGKVTAFY